MNTIVKTFLFSSLICLTGCSSMTGQYPTAQTYRKGSTLAEQTAKVPPAKSNPVLPQAFPLEPIQTANPTAAKTPAVAKTPTVAKTPAVAKTSEATPTRGSQALPESPQVVRLPPVEKNGAPGSASLASAGTAAPSTPSGSTPRNLPEVDLTNLDKIIDTGVQPVSYMELVTETEKTDKTGETKKLEETEKMEETKGAETGKNVAASPAGNGWRRSVDQETGATELETISDAESSPEPPVGSSSDPEPEIVLPTLDVNLPVPETASSSDLRATPPPAETLQVHSLTFTTSIRSRGDYTPVEKPYRFPAGEKVLLYSEVDLPEAGLPLESGYELKSSDGTVVSSQSGECQAPQGETGFFQSILFDLPKNLKPGMYTVSVWVQDKSTQNRSETTLDLEITGEPAL